MKPSIHTTVFVGDGSVFKREAFGPSESLRITCAGEGAGLVIVGTTEQLDHLCASLIPAEATEEASA